MVGNTKLPEGGAFTFDWNTSGYGKNNTPYAANSSSPELDASAAALDKLPSVDNSTSPFWGNGTPQNPGMVIPGLQAFSGLANAYLGYKNLGLSEDQFALGKDQYNRDLANQAQVYNTQLSNGYSQGLRQSGQYDTSTPEGAKAFEEALAAYVNNNRVDGSAIS